MIFAIGQRDLIFVEFHKEGPFSKLYSGIYVFVTYGILYNHGGKKISKFTVLSVTASPIPIGNLFLFHGRWSSHFWFYIRTYIFLWRMRKCPSVVIDVRLKSWIGLLVPAPFLPWVFVGRYSSFCTTGGAELSSCKAPSRTNGVFSIAEEWCQNCNFKLSNNK